MPSLDLRLADLVTFLAVQRTQSITGAARQLRVTPSQVSKSISRIEKHCNARLFARGTKGVALNEVGVRVAQHIASAVAAIEATRARSTQKEEPQRIELSLAAPSYLLEALLPSIAQSYPRLHVRGLEISPALIRGYVTESVFDVAIVPSGIDNLPGSWTRDDVGIMRKAVFGSPAVAKRLAPLPTTVDKLRQVSWIGPAASGTRFAPITDDCPLPMAERTIAHEAQTIRTALDLAASGDFLVFGPTIAARKAVRDGLVQQIPVAGWDVSEPLYVVCNGETVLAHVRDAVVRTARAAMAGG